MFAPNSTFAYVADAPASTELYRKIFGADPVQSSPKFAMFAFANGSAFGLWARSDVQPPVPAGVHAGAIEMSFPAENEDEVRKLHQDWKALGLTIIQEPTQMDFGLTFTAADPDGHRLRVHVRTAH